MVLIMTSENEPEKCSLDQSVHGKDIETSHPVPSLSSQVDPTSSSKRVESACVQPDVEQGYERACPQWENQPYYAPQERLPLPHSGVQPEDDTFPYCMPSHVTYNPEKLMAYEEQPSFQQQYFHRSGYFHQTISDVSRAMSSGSQLGAEEIQTKNVSKANEPSPVTAGSSNSEDRSSMHSETKNVKTSKPLDSKTHQLTSSSGFSGHSVNSFKAPHLNPGNQPVVTYRGHGGRIPRNTFYGSRSIYPTANNYCFQMGEKSYLCRNYEVSSELVRGPRANRIKTRSSSSVEIDNMSPSVRRNHYNRPDFVVKYEQAKFFMIKSYSEDDIHRSIKYNVWSSTPNGNNKLDAAFRKAEMEKVEKGAHCPIFLFFSVNASGQFVGLAEMTGPVDFKKNMDFWQQDKWNGFFPVEWHIIKHIPNRNFQHITLENNDNKAVTFSRDTQEIKLPQGLSMLQMFKVYQSGSSILDDFDFYENREKSLLTTRSNRPVVTSSYMDSVDDNAMKHLESSFGNKNMSSRARKPLTTSKNSSTYFTRSPTVNNRLPLNRS